jgi:TRAP-type mannitol/chloroaromatic compound transport system permease large subunit
MGMLLAGIIPAVGAGVFGSTIFAAISESEWVRNLMARLRHAGLRYAAWVKNVMDMLKHFFQWIRRRASGKP